jgi:L-fuconolactonase
VTIVDAHQHVWDLSVRGQPWLSAPRLAPIRRTFTLDDLRPCAQPAGVGSTMLVQTVALAAETAEMLTLADADPLVVGIRHQVQSEPDPDWLRCPDVIDGLRATADAGLCYDLVVQPRQLPAACHAAAAVPGLTLVIDHAGNPSADPGDLSR